MVHSHGQSSLPLVEHRLSEAAPCSPQSGGQGDGTFDCGILWQHDHHVHLHLGGKLCLFLHVRNSWSSGARASGGAALSSWMETASGALALSGRPLRTRLNCPTVSGSRAAAWA